MKEEPNEVERPERDEGVQRSEPGEESVDDSVFIRPGDPDEFDEELEGELADPDSPGDISIPPGLLRRLVANPTHVPELLAARAVEQFASRADRDVRLLRERNPHATDRQLALSFKRKYSRAARWEGAGTGTAGLLGLPVDLVLLAWLQNRLVLSVAAAYGHDMDDHLDRAADLLMIQGVHNSREVAKKTLINATQKQLTKIILKHLRKEALVAVKQLFKVVNIKFTRKALLEKGVPLVAIPISAGINDVSTRLLANQAIKFYDTTII